MLGKFITAMAWLWAVPSAFGVLVQFIPPVKPDDVERAGRIFIFGIPAWAWLIARYLL